jgi:hypothetical protein
MVCLAVAAGARVYFTGPLETLKTLMWDVVLLKGIAYVVLSPPTRATQAGVAFMRSLRKDILSCVGESMRAALSDSIEKWWLAPETGVDYPAGLAGALSAVQDRAVRALWLTVLAKPMSTDHRTLYGNMLQRAAYAARVTWDRGTAVPLPLQRLWEFLSRTQRRAAEEDLDLDSLGEQVLFNPSSLLKSPSSSSPIDDGPFVFILLLLFN